jgi:hypothetical protein
MIKRERSGTPTKREAPTKRDTHRKHTHTQRRHPPKRVQKKLVSHIVWLWRRWSIGADVGAVNEGFVVEAIVLQSRLTTWTKKTASKKWVSRIVLHVEDAPTRPAKDALDSTDGEPVWS